MSASRTLRLTLKQRWFDMIASGEKREEYRIPGPWILSRLEGKEYDRIEFKTGFGANVPKMEVEYCGWKYAFGKREWGGGGEQGKPFVAIYLGRILFLNYPKTKTQQILDQYQTSLAALEQHKARLFYPGTSVHVNCKRYCGHGIAVTDNQCPPDQVAIKLQNGNVWWYSITDCSPIPSIN